MTQLSDLNFTGKDTLYATHALHAFAAKCPPPLVRWGIECYSEPRETVLDPMMGSGTTLVEARLLNRHGIGLDIDPVARLMAEVKATPLCLDLLDRATTVLLAAIDAAVDIRQQPKTPETHHIGQQPAADAPPNGKWFLPEVAANLALVKRHIAAVDTSVEIRRYFWVAFSSLILARTSVANARDIVHSRHHYWKHAITPDVLGIFRRRLTTMRRMMKEFTDHCSPEGHTTVLDGDVRTLPLPDNSVQLVFTSPPYGTALDYTRAHALAVVWLQDVLETTAEAYAVHARKYIGTDRALRTTFNAERYPLPDITQLREMLEQLRLTDLKKALALNKYFVDMTAALAEMGRVVQPGRHIVLVVCPSHIRKTQIPTNELLIQIATQLTLPGGYSLRLEQQIERTLDDRKRLLPYMTEAFGQRMRTEYVIVLQKSTLSEHGNA